LETKWGPTVVSELGADEVFGMVTLSLIAEGLTRKADAKT